MFKKFEGCPHSQIEVDTTKLDIKVLKYGRRLNWKIDWEVTSLAMICVREKEKMKGRILENIFFRTLLLKVPSIAQQHRHYHEVC